MTDCLFYFVKKLKQSLLGSFMESLKILFFFGISEIIGKKKRLNLLMKVFRCNNFVD